MPQYDIYVSCNECGGEHPLGIGLHLDQGPDQKQSIGETFPGGSAPPQVAAVEGHKCLCAKTGKRFVQEDAKRIFLVPVRLTKPLNIF